MNPGLSVKLRPSTPWRIGPDSGERNRVDSVYHSDSLYSAITSAMARLGHLEDWLGATARAAEPAVCFSSCFPFADGIRFVAPPRNVWPPTSPALMSARVRWKSAKFVPLEVVQAILNGQPLNENRWAVDGVSGCLMPAGSAGPFRTALRRSAAIDRMTGAADRHSVACTEFRAGAGLWTVVSFADDAARDRWQGPVKAAFRWLADSGFGGERSRGWGRADAPEFEEGQLPSMILGAAIQAGGPDVVVPPLQEPPPEPSPVHEPIEDPELPKPEPDPELPLPDPEPEPEPEPLFPGLTPSPAFNAHWMLSLFSPAASDAVDWTRGDYTLLERGGRVDSPVGSGELKKQLQMVSEGSVVYAPSAPRGAALDVAPDGFSHPVFRAGFAVAIPLSGGG